MAHKKQTTIHNTTWNFYSHRTVKYVYVSFSFVFLTFSDFSCLFCLFLSFSVLFRLFLPFRVFFVFPRFFPIFSLSSSLIAGSLSSNAQVLLIYEKNSIKIWIKKNYVSLKILCIIWDIWSSLWCVDTMFAVWNSVYDTTFDTNRIAIIIIPATFHLEALHTNDTHPRWAESNLFLWRWYYV